MKIAVIGLGEVGSHYARGLAAGGAYVSAYNRNMDDTAKRERYKALERDGVKLCSTVEDTVRESALILAVTTSHTALDTARSVLPYLTAGQIYVECNSTVPANRQCSSPVRRHRQQGGKHSQLPCPSYHRHR